MKWIACILLPLFLSASPAQVILIRHAEKPPSGNELSLKGRERAAAFVPYFQGSPNVLSYGLPIAIFATKASQDSGRPMETMQPLADILGLPIQNQFAKHQTQLLSNEILTNPDYEGKMILVCWSHSEIPAIASLLGAKKAPTKWPDDTFDRLWLLTFDDEGKVSFKDAPQKILFGDSAK